MKYRLYIDEVGNPDLNSSSDENHRFLSLTGVIFELGYVSVVLSPELEAIKSGYFGSHPDEPIILHRKELLYKKPPFSSLKDSDTERRFNSELLERLRVWQYSVITVIIDKREHAEKYARWRYDPYHYCLEILVERYRLFLNIASASGDVMVESRGAKEDMRLKRSFRKIMETGRHSVTGLLRSSKVRNSSGIKDRSDLTGLKNFHKKTPLPGQGPYNPPPPHKWINAKIVNYLL